jgi:acetate kinase
VSWASVNVPGGKAVGAVAFTGGIAEHRSEIRAICDRLTCFGVELDAATNTHVPMR